jgi:hypothetical protein
MKIRFFILFSIFDFLKFEQEIGELKNMSPWKRGVAGKSNEKIP